jgi:predicted RNA binding protein YcfA (HicA-like mRNA interferase family)
VPKLPRVSSQKTVQILEKLGFIPIRQRGSHLILKKEITLEEGEIRDLRKNNIRAIIILPWPAFFIRSWRTQ